MSRDSASWTVYTGGEGGVCSENGYFLHDEMLKPTEALDPMNNKCTISSLCWHLGPLLGDDDDDDDDGLRSFPPSPANLENF